MEKNMKEKLKQFIESLLIIFAVIILIFTIPTKFLGEKTREFSNLFLLGNQGLAIKTILQFFAFSFLINIFRFVFLTDMIFKKARPVLRYLLFFLSTTLVFALFALIFHWIPNKPLFWLLVLLSYSVSTIISILITNFFAKKEDARMNDALAKMQERC